MSSSRGPHGIDVLVPRGILGCNPRGQYCQLGRHLCREGHLVQSSFCQWVATQEANINNTDHSNRLNSGLQWSQCEVHAKTCNLSNVIPYVLSLVPIMSGQQPPPQPMLLLRESLVNAYAPALLHCRTHDTRTQSPSSSVKAFTEQQHDAGWLRDSDRVRFCLMAMNKPKAKEKNPEHQGLCGTAAPASSLASMA